MREVILRVTNNKGENFSEKEIEQLVADKAEVDGLSEGERPSEELLARSKERGQVFDYKIMCCQILEVPKPGGFDRAEMRKIDGILDKIEDAESPGSVLLEEEEWLYLKNKVQAHKFPTFSKGALEFVDQIVDRTGKVKVEKVTEE